MNCKLYKFNAVAIFICTLHRMLSTMDVIYWIVDNILSSFLSIFSEKVFIDTFGTDFISSKFKHTACHKLFVHWRFSETSDPIVKIPKGMHSYTQKLTFLTHCQT